MCEIRDQLRRMQTKCRREEKVALGTRNKDLVGLTATYSCHAQSRPHGVSSGVSIKLKRRHATSQGNDSEAATCLASCRTGEALTCGNGFMRGSWGMDSRIRSAPRVCVGRRADHQAGVFGSDRSCTSCIKTLKPTGPDHRCCSCGFWGGLWGDALPVDKASGSSEQRPCS